MSLKRLHSEQMMVWQPWPYSRIIVQQLLGDSRNDTRDADERQPIDLRVASAHVFVVCVLVFHVCFFHAGIFVPRTLSVSSTHPKKLPQNLPPQPSSNTLHTHQPSSVPPPIQPLPPSCITLPPYFATFDECKCLERRPQPDAAQP